jgi:hypothetical protein
MARPIMVISDRNEDTGRQAMSNSKKHHWWPICVSEFWKDSEGRTTRLSPDGAVVRSPPKRFGVIRHGHSIKLGAIPGEVTVWDHNFESEFQRADGNFPTTIRWLEGLDREHRPRASTLTSRFLGQSAPEKNLRQLVECLVSLAVRSPMNRHAAVSWAEEVRGKLPERERNVLVASNMQNRQRMNADAFGARGKFAVIYSPDREFIFGDGFFHNITSPAGSPMSPKILAPLTPRMSVLFTIPLRYTTEPKLSTLAITAAEADALNRTVQIYAKDMLFFRSEAPEITEEFRRGMHLCYADPGNPIDTLIHGVPGVPPRDTSLDFLFRGR